MAITVLQIHMEAPDAIGVWVLDPLPVKGNIIASDESATAYDTTVTRNNPRDGGAAQSCRVIGNNKDKVRFQDQQPTAAECLDRAAARTIANWTTISGRTITAIRYRCRPWADAISLTGGSCHTSQLHEFILELNDDLPQGGPYVIENVAADIPATDFIFSDTETQAIGIRCDHVGYRPDDIWKVAVLAARRNGRSYGAVDFLTDYGFTTFNILDREREVVYTGDIVEKCGPSDTEPNFTNLDVADFSRPLSISSISKATLGICTTSTNHGLVNGDKVRFRAISGMTQIPQTGAALTVTRINDTQFTFGVNTIAFSDLTTGTWNTTYGYENIVYPTVNLNKCGTYVCWMDFSDFEPVTYGQYAIQIEGYGIGPWFRIDPAVHGFAAAMTHKGIYSLRRGCDLDIGDYVRGANLVDDGIGDVHNYKSLVPAGLAAECTQNGSDPQFDSGMAAYYPNITSTRVSLTDTGMSHQDAGDLDGFLIDHAPFFYLIEMILSELDEPARHTPYFEVPRSSVLIDSSRYAGTDALPSLLHECFWYADHYRSMQNVDGSVPSGIGVGHFTAQTQNYPEVSSYYRGSGSLDPVTADPATGTRVHAYYYAPDHWSNFWACITFAKTALLCYEYSLTDLGDWYKEGAIDAYAWAENLLNDSTAQDAYYDAVLGLKQLALTRTTTSHTITSVNTTTDVVTTGTHGFPSGRKVGGIAPLPGGLSEATDYWVNTPSTTTLSFHTNSADAIAGTNKINLTDTTAGGRIFRSLTDTEYTDESMADLDTKAALVKPLVDAVMFRLLGPVDGAAHEAAISSGLGATGYPGWAMFEYIRAAPGSNTKANAFRAAHNGGLTDNFEYLDQANVTFPYMGPPASLSIWQPGGPGEYERIARALFLAIDDSNGGSNSTVRDQCVRAFQAQRAFVQGTSLMGMCYTKGMGYVNPKLALHEDSFALGVQFPDGIVPYSFDLWPVSSAGFGSVAGGLEYQSDNIGVSGASVDRRHTLFEPWRYSLPYWDCYSDNRQLIRASEYSIGTGIIACLLFPLICHGWDGNAETEVDSHRLVRLKWAA